jgi:hypothetical protein
MNSKYIFIFVMSLVIGSAFVLFVNSDSDVEVTTVPETTTTTTLAPTTTTLAPTTTTTTTTLAPTTTTTTTTLAPTTTTLAPTTTTTTLAPTTTTTLGDEESVQIVDDNEETPPVYEGEYSNFSGFEGTNQFKLDELVLALPQVLQDILKDKIIYINGCHEYAKSLVGRCPYGVWDSSGTNIDGTKGAEWSMSIWVSNRAFDAEQAKDVLTHESSHALSYITRNCNTQNNLSYRLDAWNYFGGEEKFADALVLYFGGSYNHYRELGDLNRDERTYLEEYIAACTNT